MYTIVGVDVGAIVPHALFLELAGLVLVEAVLPIAAVREEGALNKIKKIKNSFNKYIFL